jgi:hypothetical protein
MRRALLGHGLLWFAFATHGITQTPPSHPPAAADQKRGAATAPTHAPQPAVPPLLLFEHFQNGNAAAAAAIAAHLPLPPPAERPAGAGRYLAAVVICADADVDAAALFCQHRNDILLLSMPGPFLHAEAVALLERTVREERLGLILLVGHDGCRTLQPTTNGTADALTRRRDAIAAEAERRRMPLTKALLQVQREHLLAASELLRQQLAADTLRVLPASIDKPSGRCTWLHQAIDAMPLAPVK